MQGVLDNPICMGPQQPAPFTQVDRKVLFCFLPLFCNTGTEQHFLLPIDLNVSCYQVIFCLYLFFVAQCNLDIVMYYILRVIIGKGRKWAE